MALKRNAFVLLSYLLVSRAEGNPLDVFRTFGLEGVWSPNCARPTSHENPRVYFQMTASGQFRHGVSFDGKIFALTDVLSDAIRLTDNRLQFSAVRSDKIALIVIVERIGDKIHTVTSTGADGTVYYRDGIEVATGKPALTDERCDGAVPIS